MLRIFRHFRQKLMQENKVRSYLLYALGEIILVVIGIVLAIQVSNWNENRILNESARSHLALLHQDLNEDKQLLEELIQNFETNDESVKRILNGLKRIQPLSDKTPEDLINLQLEYNFSERQNAMEVLINSGEIGVLDASVQNLISRYYTSVDAIHERDFITNSFIQNKFEAHIFNEYNYIYGLGNEHPALIKVYSDDQRAPIKMDLEQLSSDKKLEALLVARLYQNEQQKELYEFAVERLEELQDEIRKEDGGRKTGGL